MFGKCCCIDQTCSFTDGFCFVHSMLPPCATAEAAAVVIKAVRGIKRPEIVWAFPTVYLAKLCATGFLTLVRGRCAQGAAGFAFFVGVMQDKDVLIAFFVLACCIFGGHPAAIAFWIK